MDNYFESILLDGMRRCEDFYRDGIKNGFGKLYPYTTENINGYIKSFDLENKSLLTVGSSLDQAINACLYKSRDITVIDICPFTKFYFYLKVAGILTLDYNNFLRFFCYKDFLSNKDFSKSYYDNNNAFSLKQFRDMKLVLRSLDYESYLFWDELFSNYPGERIRRRLFSHDEYKVKVLKKINLYLRDEDSFNKTKQEICKVFPKFIIGDIFEVDIDKKYDNIWLSNIGKYLSLDDFKKLVDKLDCYLNEDGKMLICYLYETVLNTKYEYGWEDIYKLDKVFEAFKEYDLKLIDFTGIRDILFGFESSNDSILLYKKKKR